MTALPIPVPPEWGIQRRLADVQAAVSAIATQVLEAGLRIEDIRWVWQEIAAWLLPRHDIEVRHVARGKITVRRPHAGRLLGQAGLLVRRLIRSVVPAFFHSQSMIAHALALGLERDGERKGEPKPIPRRPDGTLGDAPGVRHTRDLLHLLERVGLLVSIERTGESQHVLGREARTDVHVLALPERAKGFLRELAERVRGRRAAPAASNPAAATPAAPARPAPGTSSPAPRSAPAPRPPGRDDAAYAELVQLHAAAHERRYRAAIEHQTGKPYSAASAGTIRAEYREAIAQALHGLVHRACQRALAKGRDLRPEDVRTAILEAIVAAYMEQTGEWVEGARHPLGGLWAMDPRGNRELDVLGERVLDEWSGDIKPPSAERRAEEADDDEEARLACAELRAQLQCFAPAPAEEPMPRPVQRGQPLSAEQRRALAEMDAAQKPP